MSQACVQTTTINYISLTFCFAKYLLQMTNEAKMIANNDNYCLQGSLPTYNVS